MDCPHGPISLARDALCLDARLVPQQRDARVEWLPQEPPGTVAPWYERSPGPWMGDGSRNSPQGRWWINSGPARRAATRLTSDPSVDPETPRSSAISCVTSPVESSKPIPPASWPGRRFTRVHPERPARRRMRRPLVVPPRHRASTAGRNGHRRWARTPSADEAPERCGGHRFSCLAPRPGRRRPRRGSRRSGRRPASGPPPCPWRGAAPSPRR